MTKKHAHIVVTTEEKPDGLRRIKGLRKATADQLNACGIHTCAQLSALSPACVAELVRDASVESIAEQWIKKARKLASALPPEEFRYDATFTVKLTLDTQNNVQNTSVVHLQDRVEDKWSDWSDGRLKDFIERHAAPRPKREAAVENPLFQPVGDHERGMHPAEFQLDVGAMSLEEAELSQEGDERALRKHMCAHFDFHLSGQVAQQLAGTGLPYFVQLVACDLGSGQATLLATDQSRLTSGLVTYPVALQFPLPELGRYQLVGLVLLPDKDKVGVTLGDVLNVVP